MIFKFAENSLKPLTFFKRPHNCKEKNSFLLLHNWGEIFLKPIFSSHHFYQESIIQRLRQHYSGEIFVIVNDDWPLVTKFWMIDLSYMTTLLHDVYDAKGPKPRDPASMLRSFLLFLMTKPEIGITEWINEMKRIPYYAILSGFEPGDIPGVGTFYDFFKRLWTIRENNLKSNRQKRKRKIKKGAKGQKASTTTPGKVNRLVKWVLRHVAKKSDLPSDRLFHFFQTQILTISANMGLIGDIDNLCAAGDGTPIVTAAYPRSKSTCDCRAQGLANCPHPRIYSQPDCNIGWDSHREKFYNGYHLYMISAANSHNDLPLYPKLQPASRHDSISLVISWAEFKQRFSLGTVKKILLDAAHDAQSIYYLLDHHGVEPFIDLNNRSKKSTATTSDIRISPNGTPICPINLEMKSNGSDNLQHRNKWRCPLSCKTKNSCTTPCSDAKYGRTFHTPCLKDNLRLFPNTPRGSDKWTEIYKRRTSIERSNKREKIDYKLESGRHRSTKMWYIRIFGIMICQHLDAWFLHVKEDFTHLKTLIFPKTA